MDSAQLQIVSILFITVGLFLWGRWRHDLVALASLLACVIAGLVPAEQAFLGFGHPAVITVASVLILSRGLQDSGAIDRLAQHVIPRNLGPVAGIGALTALGAVLSAFMNNVGAMALLLPLALQMSGRLDLPPGRILMPLAFGTILGGMTTLIGTPPNLIVSGFRAEEGLGAFGMFDFTPVGASVAAAGLIFVSLVGWRLVPARPKEGAGEFETGAYLTEARIEEGGRSVGWTLSKAGAELEEDGAQIVGLVRNGTRMYAPNRRHRIRPDDILLIEADPEDLAQSLSRLDAVIGEPPDKPESTDKESADGGDKGERSDPVTLQELVIMPNSTLVGRTAKGVQLGPYHGLSLLAVSRQGQRSIRRLNTMRFKAGDLLLMQGPPEALAGFSSQFSVVPLAQRDIRMPGSARVLLASAIMAAAILLVALGVLPAAISFALGVVAMGVTGLIAPRNLYRSVDWPVIVLLAALIPVAGAMASTGTADLLANALLFQVAGGSPVLALGLMLVVTMTLSDFMNNAATAAVMCPIALSGAAQLGVNSDPLLMAVAIGASCAFLTPIGHQNNTLILGPGGLRFGDYWRLGLPMELLVVAVSIPMILVVWPL
jgi:di/tricarboxylate transporter